MDRNKINLYIIGKPGRSKKFTVILDRLKIQPDEYFLSPNKNSIKSCSESHILALKKFLNTKSNHCVILENDALLTNDVSWMTQTNYDFFVPFSDNRSFVPSDSAIQEGLLPYFGAFAYVISRKLAEDVVSYYKNTLDERGYDEFLFELAKKYTFACTKGNLVNHDNFLSSTISEERRYLLLNCIHSKNLMYAVANYNNEKYLEFFLKSLYEQSDPNWYACIVDDASTDNSKKILENIEDPRIFVLYNNKNIGYPATLNKIFENSFSEWVAVVDPDDVLDKDNCLEIRSVISKLPSNNFSLLYTNFYYCDENLQIIKNGYCRALKSNESALNANSISHTKIINVRYFEKVGGYNTDFLLAEDKDIIFKLEEVGLFYFIDKKLYFYRQRTDSLSNLHQDKKEYYLNLARKRARARRFLKTIKNKIDIFYNYIRKNFIKIICKDKFKYLFVVLGAMFFLLFINKIINIKIFLLLFFIEIIFYFLYKIFQSYNVSLEEMIYNQKKDFQNMKNLFLNEKSALARDYNQKLILLKNELQEEFTLKLSEQNQIFNERRKEDFRQTEVLFAINNFIKEHFTLPSFRNEAISPDFGLELVELIFKNKIKKIVELGSGTSTILMGHCLRQIGAGKIYTFEQDEVFFNQTKAEIIKHDLSNFVDLRLSKLKDYKIKEKKWKWYDLNFFSDIQEIELLIVNGPSGNLQRNSRYPAVPLICEKLKNNSIVILDDIKRKEEKDIFETWFREYNFISQQTKATENGVGILVYKKR